MATRPETPSDEVETTAPPAMEEETGIALEGDYPHNHRLRAERMAREGLDEDPDGIISRELIADTAERLERDDRALAEARPAVRANMRTAELERIAAKENIDISGASTNADRVRLIEEARSAGPAPTEGVA